MDIYIRNKWVSLGGSSVVKNVNEEDIYKVKGKFFTFTRKKEVMSLDDELLYTVRNKFWTFFVKKAYIYNPDGTEAAYIQRKFFTIKDHYLIDSKYGQIEIVGNFFLHDYRISANNVQIGHVARKISLRDSYVLSIDDHADIPFYIALVIAIDNITDERRDNSSSISFGNNNN